MRPQSQPTFILQRLSTTLRNIAGRILIASTCDQWTHYTTSFLISFAKHDKASFDETLITYVIALGVATAPILLRKSLQEHLYVAVLRSVISLVAVFED